MGVSCRMFRALGTLTLLAAVCIGPAFAADSSYTPSGKDLMSIQQAMHRYHEGLDKQDNRLMASAFGEDGTVTMCRWPRHSHCKKKSRLH